MLKNKTNLPGITGGFLVILKKNMSERKVNWKAIYEEMGLPVNIFLSIDRNWKREPQTSEEVRKGVLHERAARLETYSRHLEDKKER